MYQSLEVVYDTNYYYSRNAYGTYSISSDLFISLSVNCHV